MKKDIDIEDLFINVRLLCSELDTRLFEINAEREAHGKHFIKPEDVKCMIQHIIHISYENGLTKQELIDKQDEKI